MNRLIIVAYDASFESKRALEWTVDKLIAENDTLLVIQVHSDQTESVLFIRPLIQTSYQIHDHIRRLLSHKNLNDYSVRIRVDVQTGDPKKILIESLAEFKPFCIVLGSRGMSNLKG
jgi:nucleotide-binding universal stress UspA family protein